MTTPDKAEQPTADKPGFASKILETTATVVVTLFVTYFVTSQNYFGLFDLMFSDILNMKGAVVAFSREKGDCPTGWEAFEPAGGRFIVGAGVHSNMDENGEPLTKYSIYKDQGDGASDDGSIGGLEAVKLTEDNLPPHSHKLRRSNNSGSGVSGHMVNWNNMGDQPQGESAQAISSTGNGAAHKNLPPYVALKYCIRK